MDHYVGHESWGKAIAADTTGWVGGIGGAVIGSSVPVVGTAAGAVVGVVAATLVKNHWKDITHSLDDAATSGEHLMYDAAHSVASGWKHLWD